MIYSTPFPQKINEKPQIIADYECGRAIPNNQVMGKIERAIGKCVTFNFSKTKCWILLFSRLYDPHVFAFDHEQDWSYVGRILANPWSQKPKINEHKASKSALPNPSCYL